jgi:hypothetical protein
MSGKYKIDVTPDITGTRMDKNGQERTRITNYNLCRANTFLLCIVLVSWVVTLPCCRHKTQNDDDTDDTIEARRKRRIGDL